MIGAAAPAFAAITSPSANPYTVPVDSGYNPQPFTVTANGYGPNQSVYIEVCDGLPSTTHGWDPTLDCDNGTSPAAATANSAGTATFPATNPNFQIGDFNGVSPSNSFNCISSDEIPADAVKQPNGSYQLGSGDNTVTNNSGDQFQVNPSDPTWTNCQLRVSSNNAAVTSDQQLITLTIPSAPTNQTPESPLAILLPIGAAGLLGGGVLIARRRRSNRLAA
jgi:hypothetical protein